MDLYANILPSTKFNRHTHRSVSNSTDIYIWHTNWFMDLYTDLVNQHSSQVTKLSRHTYQTTRTNRCEPNSADTSIKLSTPTNVELNDCNRSTFLPRYRTQPTHIPNYNAPTNVELNDCNRSTFLPRYRTQPTYLPNYTHQSVWT